MTLERTKDNVLNKEIQRRSKHQMISTFFESNIETFFLKNESHTFKKVMFSVDSSFWEEVVNSETYSTLSNYTWMFIDLSLGNKTCGFKVNLQKENKS